MKRWGRYLKFYLTSAEVNVISPKNKTKYFRGARDTGFFLRQTAKPKTPKYRISISQIPKFISLIDFQNFTQIELLPSQNLLSFYLIFRFVAQLGQSSRLSRSQITLLQVFSPLARFITKPFFFPQHFPNLGF